MSYDNMPVRVETTSHRGVKPGVRALDVQKVHVYLPC